MNYQSSITQHVLIAIFGVLIVASIIGAVLKRRVTTEGGKKTVSNLNARVKSWWVMAILIFTVLSLNIGVIACAFALISFLALREFITATPTGAADHRALLTSFFIVLPYQYWLVYTGWYGMFAIMIPVYAFLLIPILNTLAGDTKDFLERSARTQWGLMVCVYFISHIPKLLTLEVPLREDGMGRVGLVIFLVAVIQGSDVLQYVWGKLCGKRRIAPVLSPSKTLEGLVGGVLTASLLGMAMFRLTPFTPWQAFFTALILCIMGFFGGLVMSAIKRDRGIKDWGNLIEGHGGMMDRIDSLCFSAPVFFHILRYFFTP